MESEDRRGWVIGVRGEVCVGRGVVVGQAGHHRIFIALEGRKEMLGKLYEGFQGSKKYTRPADVVQAHLPNFAAAPYARFLRGGRRIPLPEVSCRKG